MDNNLKTAKELLEIAKSLVANKNVAGWYGKYENFTGTIDWKGTKAEVTNATFELRDDGTYWNVIWKSGTWENGTLHYGTWYDGIWKNGTWEDGKWFHGTWRNGIFKNGEWEIGTWENGTWNGRIWWHGTWKNGIWKGGEWFRGTWENGTWIYGKWDGGKWKGGKDCDGKYHPEGNSPDIWGKR